MKTSFSLMNGWHGPNRSAQILTLALVVTTASAFRTPAADEAAAQKMLAEARAKEAHAEQLHAAAAAATQKGADDQMEASAEERDARILTAQALKLLGADANRP